MPRVLTRYIDEPKVYACANCKTHLSSDGRVMSKEFHTANGRGYLIKEVINVTNGPSEQRTLMTGVHTCEDVFCISCNVMLGWEYSKVSGTLCGVIDRSATDSSSGESVIFFNDWPSENRKIISASIRNLSQCYVEKYAFEEKEQYKVGNFVLEEVKIMKYHW